MSVSVQMQTVQKLALSPRLQSALRVLSMNSLELREFLTQQQSENVLLELGAPACGELPLPIQAHTYQQPYRAAHMDEKPSFDLPEKETVARYLYRQLNVPALSSAELRAAKILLSCLDEDGYLRVALPQLSDAFGLPVSSFMAALKEIRALDPPGVGAQSLSDCLCLQLQRRGCTDSNLYAIVNSYLDELAQAQYKTIARGIGLSLNKTITLCGQVRSLKPHPISFFQRPCLSVPDITVTCGPNGLEIEVNDSYLPKPHLNPLYARLNDCDEQTQSYIKQKTAAAKDVISAVEMRRSTLSMLASLLVARQLDFFLAGAPLIPLSRSALALELKVHESTVSRAVQGKTLCCDRGLFPLSHFFPYALSDGLSSSGAKEAVLALLQKDPGLSDCAITDLLAQDGIVIARRTVAKYRSAEGIPAMHQRVRRQKAAQTN